MASEEVEDEIWGEEFVLEGIDDDEEEDSYGILHIHDEDEEGCLFPEKCVMPGYHLKSECCTAEMMQQMYEAGES